MKMEEIINVINFLKSRANIDYLYSEAAKGRVQDISLLINFTTSTF